MPRTFTLLLALLALPLLAAPLLPNGDFSAELKGWSHNPQVASCDTRTFVSGPASLRLNGTGFVSQKIDYLERHTIYEISGFIKGENIAGDDPNCGARVILEGNQKWKRIVPNPDGKPETGTFDWKYFQVTFTPNDLDSDSIIVSANLTGTGTAWFDDLKVVKKSPASSANLVELKESFRTPHGPGLEWVTLWAEGERGFFPPDTPLTFSLKVNDEGKALRAEAALKDDEGQERHRLAPLSFTTPDTLRFSFPGVPDQGYYIATVELYEGDTHLYTIQAAAAVFPKPEKRDPFYAVGFEALGSLHDGFKYLGVGTINLKIQVADIQAYKAEEAVEEFFRKYKPFLESGDFQLGIVYPFAIRRTGRTEEELAQGWPVLPDYFLTEILKVVRAIAERTHDFIKDWGIQQEIPSSATMDFKFCGNWSEAMAHQVILTRLISRAVKAIDPTLRVWTGGNNQVDKVDTIERIVLADIKDDADGYLVDAYTGNWDLRQGNNVMLPETRLLKFLRDSSNLSKMLGKGELIRNEETGYAIYYGAPYDRGMAWRQAALTARSMIIMRAAPVCLFEIFTPAHWYPPTKQHADDEMFMSTCWRPVMDGSRSGLNHVPLPGGAMYATLAREFTFTTFHREIICDKLYCYVFTRGDGKTFAAAWTIGEAPVTISPALPAATRKLSMTGRVGSLGEAGLELSTAPVYLVSDLPAAEVADALETAMLQTAPRFRLAAVHGKTPDQLVLYVLNYSSATTPAEVTVDDGPAKQVSLLPQVLNTITLPAGQTVGLKAEGKRYEVTLDNSQHAPTRIQRLAVPPHLDGTLEWTKDLTPIQLRHPDNVYPKTALHREKALFYDPVYNPKGHTVAADCFLAYDDDFLYVAAKVDDPTHVQHFEDAQIWRGDALQLAFATKPAPPAEVRTSNTSPEEYDLETNIGVALRKDDVVKVLYGPQPQLLDFPARVVHENAQTIYELAIPWNTLGFSPKECLRLGLVIFDSNSPANQEPPYWLSFGQGIAGGQDSTLLRPVTFQ